MTSMGIGVNDEKLAAEAMERIAPDAAAVPLEELAQVNLDLQHATGTILGALPEVMALREQIIKELPAFDIKWVDRLEDYALALRFAHAAYQTASQAPDDLQPLSEEATAMRERLLADAKSLALRNLVDPRKLESGAKGIKNIVQDLQMLSQVLQERWPQIQGKTPTTAEDLATASRIGTRITRVVGLREQSPSKQNAVVEQRARVFALTMRAYDETRAAIAFVRRREGDTESITPNLYSGKGRYRAPIKPGMDEQSESGSASTASARPPSVTPEAVAAVVEAHKGGPGSKGPFLT
jgi:hypothetical protein